MIERTPPAPVTVVERPRRGGVRKLGPVQVRSVLTAVYEKGQSVREAARAVEISPPSALLLLAGKTYQEVYADWYTKYLARRAKAKAKAKAKAVAKPAGNLKRRGVAK